MDLTITKRDGTKEPFDADKINKSIERACQGLTDPIGKTMQIASETQLTLYDGITTEEMDQATINAALQNAQTDIEYDKAATRLLLKTIYKKAIGDYVTDKELEALHRQKFPEYIRTAIEMKLLDPRMSESFNLEELAEAMKLERDELYKYSGVSTMQNRYFIKDREQHPMETPQYFWMRVAMGMSFLEKDPTAQAKSFYEKMSTLEYLSAGSTNVGAGTVSPKLSNCFLLEMHDDIEHIGKTVSDVLLLSKATGGIGLSVTKIRAEGSLIKSNNTLSSGPVPFMHIIDSAIRSIVRGGKKRGALCFYMENWHIGFDDFIDLKQNAGDDYQRTRTANTAAFISDEFMRRVEAGEMWYMFDPHEVSDLNELYGEAFSKRYAEYIAMAEAGNMRMVKKVPAREQYKKMLVSLETTSHPWLTWKDSINLRALNNNTGTIHMSNLCTEITLPQDRDNIAVCNLVSVNLPQHMSDGVVDWKNFEQSVRSAIRQLDNLIDINVLPLKEATRADKANRAVGLGLMGLSEALEFLNLAYEDEAAFDFTDKVFEAMSYFAIDESANLARERGSYPNFEGSGWSKGMVPMDTMAVLEKERGMAVDVKKASSANGPAFDWMALKEKVKGGMRNATVLAIAPNANIGLVAGTAPGIDPRFAQMFSRNKISGKYLEVNHNLVKALEKLGIWEQVRNDILKSHGDIADIDGIPDNIKRVYKTSFEISPYAFIEIAARAQKWIDQALSRNMYLDTRDIEEVMNIYSTAWKKGLKTTYYLHMKPRHSAEQSTTKVNKGEALGKKGFGAVRSQSIGQSAEPAVSAQPTPSPLQNSPAPVPTIIAAAHDAVVTDGDIVDPNDRLICESCQ